MAREKAQKKLERPVVRASVPATKTNVDAGTEAGTTADWRPWALLLGALLAGLVVYWPVLDASWFYDDNDYVILDPRLDHLSLYMPNHWGEAPPPLQKPGQPALFIPGYEKPIYAERYLWHLSFALERALFGVSPTATREYSVENPTGGDFRYVEPMVSHGINIFIHLCSVAMLFLALWRLVTLYLVRSSNPEPPSSPDPQTPVPDPRLWRLLPGVAALIFAVHPWASEPVCYISARNGSMGAFFTLAGLWCWTWLFGGTRVFVRVLAVAGALVCALAAYACKENFIAAPAGYVLATWPLIWSATGKQAYTRVLALAGVAVALVCLACLGIHYSDRASGLLAQAAGAGWPYFFQIQSPVLLMTLADQCLCRRVGLECNYPGWPAWASVLSIFVNLGLIGFAVWRGRKSPGWLALAWFYLFLLPSNSFLPRPDFLAARNVYLPTAGAATLLAAGLLAWLARVQRSDQRWFKRWAPVAAGAAFWLYLAIWSHQWAEDFTTPVEVWRQSVRVAPDHAVVRLNLCIALTRGLNITQESKDVQEIQDNLRQTMECENSETMRYHTVRPKAMARSTALRMLGDIARSQQHFAEAAQFYGQSFSEIPQVITWVSWLLACQQGDLDIQRDQALAAGLREWPNDWWTLAQRGMQHYQERAHSGTMGSDVLEDLAAAERAPNTSIPGLNQIQGRALELLINIATDKQQALVMIERLKGLGLGIAEEQIEQLRQSVLRK